MIDLGRAKQQIHDPITESTRLDVVTISQACAKQRSGRAGRIRDGFCYRLYSLTDYERMDAHDTPEILRVSLTEICLKAKMMSDGQSIEDYMQKALQPPPKENMRQSIKLLKTINALNSEEQITHLGMHLAYMPIDCQLGKMVLFAIMLKCLDPVLTIVSALSVRDPFRLPNAGHTSDNISDVRKRFDELSDHHMLLSLYQEWSIAGDRKQFCTDNHLSNGNMSMISRVRTQLLQHLKLSSLINDDNSELNANSLKWEVVKGCIAAGAFRK